MKIGESNSETKRVYNQPVWMHKVQREVIPSNKTTENWTTGNTSSHTPIPKETRGTGWLKVLLDLQVIITPSQVEQTRPTRGFPTSSRILITSLSSGIESVKHHINFGEKVDFQFHHCWVTWIFQAFPTRNLFTQNHNIIKVSNTSTKTTIVWTS